jgi:hypothetical protein
MKPTLNSMMLMAASLCACAGKPTSADDVFTPENAWDGPTADATMVTPDEFRALVASGEVAIESPGSLAARNAALQKQYEDNKAFCTASTIKARR